VRRPSFWHVYFFCAIYLPIWSSGHFFFPWLYTAKKRNQKLKVLKIKVLFEIFNSHNKKICQISIHGSIRVVKKTRYLKKNLLSYFSCIQIWLNISPGG
jgi:hypothetical protein